MKVNEIYIILIFIFGLFLLAAEIYTPGGILGFIGFIFIIISIYLAYDSVGFYFSFVLMIISFILVPIFIYYGFKRIALKPVISSVSNDLIKEEIIGAKGIVISDLKPLGYILVDNKKLEAYAEDRNMILKGEKIQVVKKVNNTIYVEKLNI